jgi:putative acetyltransferase
VVIVGFKFQQMGWEPACCEQVDPNARPMILSRISSRLRALATSSWGRARLGSMEIKVDDLGSPQVAELLNEHLEDMAAISESESMHALDLAGLRVPEITLWCAWDGSQLLGCGALKEHDPMHVEIKSMRTANAHRRKGVAAALLQFMLDEAQRRGYQLISLETGSTEPFEPAQRLYARFGFELCEPFADYSEDCESLFMSKALA